MKTKKKIDRVVVKLEDGTEETVAGSPEEIKQRPDRNFDLGGRITFWKRTLKNDDGYGKPNDKEKCTPQKNLEYANLVSSELENGFHKPVIDLDLPCRVVLSTTPGHCHLYIDTEMAWWDYQELLVALVKVGLVEQGFYDSSMKEGRTYVRPPWVKKGNSE